MARVRVEGLRELRRELKQLEDAGVWQAQLREANRRAAEIVAEEARRTARAATSPRMGHVAADSIRALAGQGRAAVAGGKATVPWYGGHEFGSTRYSQFPKPRKRGYHLIPAVKRKVEAVVAFYSDAVGRITRDAFPD